MRAIDQRIPHNYGSAVAILNGRERRRIAANTEIVRTTPEAVGVVLHGTVVVCFTKDGGIILNSGGYRTVTTKARINSALRVMETRVVQRAGEWIVRYANADTRGFFDGMVL